MFLRPAHSPSTLRRPRTLAGAIAVATLTLAACGSGADNSAGATAGGPQTLTISAADTLGDISSAIATQKGWFKDQNLTVTLVASGNNVPTMVTSGQADLAELTYVPALSAAKKGAATTAIYATNGGANGGSLFARPGTTLDQIRSKPDCKIGTVAQGTATYGFAQIYKQTAGLNCQTVTLANAAAQQAALSSGQIDAFITTPQYLGASLQANHLEVLIDTRDAAARQQYGGPDVNAPGVGFWGLSSHLPEKRAAIVSFLKVWNQAREYILSDPNGAVDTLMQTDQFKAGPRAVAQASVDASRAWLPTLTGSSGYITGDQWTTFLGQAAYYGLPNFDKADPAYAYTARVDMSYYTDALGAPKP